MDLARNTVRRVLRSGETAFSHEHEVQPRPKLGAWTAKLEQRLGANGRLSSRERLDLVRIFEDLRVQGARADTTPSAAMPKRGSASAAPDRRTPISR